MPSPYPPHPFRVSDETPVCDRVGILRDLALEGMQYASVQALARFIYAKAVERSKQFATFAAADAGMRRVMQSPSWFSKLLALEALRTVQSLPYVHDPKDEEWFQSADYTIRNGGDCKDSTVLLVALDRLLGLNAEALWITQTGQMINHVTGRVMLDGKWYWEDGSIRGAMLGESAYEAEPRLGAQDVTGRVAPAADTASAGPASADTAVGTLAKPSGVLPLVNGYPFAWSGWTDLWSGWSAIWWCSAYPYLCAAYGSVVKDPLAYGFYEIGAPGGTLSKIPPETLASTT